MKDIIKMVVLIQICNNSNSSMKEMLFHDDLLPKLIQYLDLRHAAFLMRIDKSQREELDKDRFRRMIQVKKAEEEMKRELIVSGGGRDKTVKV